MPGSAKWHRWSDYTLPDPCAPSIYSSANQKQYFWERKWKWWEMHTTVLTFASAMKPLSVNCAHPATSSVLRYWLFIARAVRDWSVSSVHLDTHSCFRLQHFSAIFDIDASVMLWERSKDTGKIVWIHQFLRASRARSSARDYSHHNYVDLKPRSRDSTVQAR